MNTFDMLLILILLFRSDVVHSFSSKPRPCGRRFSSLSQHVNSIFSPKRFSISSHHYYSANRFIGGGNLNDNSKYRVLNYDLSTTSLAVAAGAGGGTSGTLSSIATKFSNAGQTIQNESTFVLSSLFLLSTFGVTLEQRTTIGKALSAPLTTMALALVVANLGLIPFSSPIYNMVNRNLVPLAVPLLLFDSDIRRVITDTGSVLMAFFVGTVATIIGTLVAFPFIPLTALGNENWKVACALAARHIGGAINFVAVSETLGISGSSVSAAIAADNVVVALYFAFLFYLAEAGENDDDAMTKSSSSSPNKGTDMSIVNLPGGSEAVTSSSLDEKNAKQHITISTIAMSLTVASCLVTTGGIITKLLLPKGTSSLPLISFLTVSMATIFPSFFSRLRNTGTAIGIIFMQMFFAASGAAGSIRMVLRNAPSLFLFSLVQIAIHFLTLIGLGKFVFGLKEKELYLASNANVGGPTTAAAMAQAKDWQRLILPALLVGIFGYAVATVIGLALGQVLLQLPVIARNL